MALTTQEVMALVKAEVEKIQDPLILGALKSILIEPTIRHMDWDYGPKGQTFPCWVVARDEPVDTELVFSEQGFGPKAPWGLVGISYNSMGMDSGWFTNLEDAFCESFMAADLTIWDVIHIDQSGKRHVLEASLSSDEAYAKLDEYCNSVRQPDQPSYRVARREPPNS